MKWINNNKAIVNIDCVSKVNQTHQMTSLPAFKNGRSNLKYKGKMKVNCCTV